MARKPQVSRTITTTHGIVRAYNTTTEEMFELDVTLPRTYKADADFLKKAKSMYESADAILLSVIDTELVQKRYAMSEADFIRQADEVELLKDYTKTEETAEETTEE